MNDRTQVKPSLDKVIHERARLLIVTYLASSRKGRVSFGELKNKLGLTAGNLSVQLRNLEEAGYVRIGKEMRNGKPLTDVALTAKGRESLLQYIREIERLIDMVRVPEGDGTGGVGA